MFYGGGLRRGLGFHTNIWMTSLPRFWYLKSSRCGLMLKFWMVFACSTIKFCKDFPSLFAGHVILNSINLTWSYIPKCRTTYINIRRIHLTMINLLKENIYFTYYQGECVNIMFPSRLSVWFFTSLIIVIRCHLSSKIIA